MPENNESDAALSDYLYDTTNNHLNQTSMSSSGDPQRLASILQQLFFKMSDNRTLYDIPPGFSEAGIVPSSSGTLSPSFLSVISYLPVSPSDAESYRLLSVISLWFVLIINPILILFGVIGNLLATYILIECNIAKLPVSFYTIMLNISDTLNLLIPVFIFWLDNCFNRTPESGYFRDKSNFLCKALMCPDQLFAALSAWYMCAISFNRWYSVCRPSSYFSRTSTNPNRATASARMNQNLNHVNNRNEEKYSASSFIPSSSLISLDCCYCLTSNVKYRQHRQAFRSIAIITLLGILCCLYPIFMHELRPVISTNEHVFDLSRKTTHTYAVIWKRCYYSRKHEYAYDIIGIILSCLLHILPLTFVAGMSLMIILRLRQRQRLMSVPCSTLPSASVANKDKIPMNGSGLRQSVRLNSLSRKKLVRYSSEQAEIRELPGQPSLIATHKDQATLTDLPVAVVSTKSTSDPVKANVTLLKRHHSRDRTITIMLVSLAVSYLVLTLPYRLFWSYNVYIKRMYPEKLNSSVYLLKMHHIDHVLRTIRNIHYSTSFVSFIFLSKTFRRKFRQLCLGKLIRAVRRLCRKDATPPTEPNLEESVNPNENNHGPQAQLNVVEKVMRNAQSTHTTHATHSRKIIYQRCATFDETPSLIGDARMREEGIRSIVELEHDDLARNDTEE